METQPNASAASAVPPAAAPPILDAHGVGVTLGGRPVLHDVTFAVAEGERVALVGPNGSGKTTLLRTTAGLVSHTGALSLRGRPLGEWPAKARARAVALVRQQTDLAVAFTAAELVALGRAPHLGWTERLRPDDQARVTAALDAVGLGSLAGRPVTELSGGEQQRVALAQALAQDAPLLLLDEPTAHLDVRHQLDLLGRLSILADAGRTVVAALHDLERAAAFAGRLLVLADGRLVADGPPADVLTAATLRQAFGVEAEVERDGAGLRVRYLGVAHD